MEMTMKIERTFLAVALSLALAACGGADEAETIEGEGTAMAGDTTTMTTTAPMPMPADSGAMAAGGAMAGAQTIPLQAIGGAPVSGTVAVSEAGGATQVMLAVMGTGAAGTHAAHVHTGTCDAPGDVVAPLESVTADASGAGSSTTTLQLPAATVMNGQHIVAVHEAGGSPGAPVACAAIPQHSM
jgi:hypothetical protein